METKKTTLLSTNGKADVAEHHEVFDHVGLLFNEPLEAVRAALYIVDRQLRLNQRATHGGFRRAAICNVSTIILHYRPKHHPSGN